jgi:hypothetical protein
MGYHVTNRITETALDKPDTRKNESNQPGLIRLPPGLKLETMQPSIMELNDETSEMDNCRTMIKENRSLSNDPTSRSTLMGKLCRRSMALIKHKVSADGSVSNHMAQALASWLRQQGITIYTETEL